ncbi:MAG: hypothetical protein AB8E15_02295 [Bdellovibrionales bacterium]
MRFSKNKIQLSVLALLLLMLVACSDQGAADGFNSTNSLNDVTSCGPLEGQAPVNAAIQTLGDSSSADFYNFAQVKLYNSTTALDNSEAYISFYGYNHSNPDGSNNLYNNNSKIEFDVYDPNQTGQKFALLNAVTSVRAEDLAYGKLTDMVIVLRNVSSFIAVEMQVFNNNGQSSIGGNFGLLPPFQANPQIFRDKKIETYGVETNAFSLHPFSNILSADPSINYSSNLSNYCFYGLTPNAN